MYNLLDHDGASATNIWAALSRIFHNNGDTQKNALHIELCNMAQGDTPVNLFRQWIKAINDELHELSNIVSDSHLINIVIVLLNESFDNQTSFIQIMQPPLTFAKERSLLQLTAKTQARKDSCPQVFHVDARPLATPPRDVFFSCCILL
jgi:hypothetical protein